VASGTLAPRPDAPVTSSDGPPDGGDGTGRPAIGAVRGTLAVVTAAAILLSGAAYLLRQRPLLVGAFSVAATGLAGYGLRWIVTRSASTKWQPVVRGPRAVVMGLGLVALAAALEARLLAALAREW
jgi:hypothetical protein